MNSRELRAGSCELAVLLATGLLGASCQILLEANFTGSLDESQVAVSGTGLPYVAEQGGAVRLIIE